MRLTPVDGVPRGYAWGSRTAIQGLLGIPATGEPIAELWFDRQLPFLLKILAAERALSIQVHPNLAQAAAGFAAEDRRGIPVAAWGRNYRDANHKPELLCAVTPFDALCGFRPVADTLRFLSELDVAALDPVRQALVGSEGLKAAFTTVLGTPDADRQRLIDATLVGCRHVAGSSGEWRSAADAVLSVAADFPGDMGAIVALLLNSVHLDPGEAIYLDAGNVHAYLRGTGVEIMANSDNVLRAGLTPKHVDVPELLRISDFTELVDPRCPSIEEGDGTRRFLTPARDFELSILPIDRDASERSVDRSVDQMLLCTAGSVEVVAGSQEVGLVPGHAVFVPAGLATKCVGTGTVFQATTPS